MSNQQLEARIAKLEARLQEHDDERAIRELLTRYGYNADCNRNQEYVDLYTDDGAIDLRANEGDGVRIEGKSDLTNFINNTVGHVDPKSHGTLMHVQDNNVVIHISGDTAVANSYSFVLEVDGDSFKPFTAGNNQWTLKKVDGVWLIKERRWRQLGGNLYTKNLDATPK